MYKEQNEKYYLYLLCSVLILGVTIVTFSSILICGRNKRKKLMKKKINKNINKKKKDISDVE